MSNATIGDDMSIELFPPYFGLYSNTHLNRDMRFPTMWYVRPAEAQTSLCIRAV